MKKAVMIVAAGLFITGLKAQSIQEGVNHLYADRFGNAVKVFQGLLAANPNNTEAAYWLGQTYLDMDTNAEARALYDKTLTSSNNAPLILVGRAHVDLLDKKLPEARQKFETAITMSRGKKGEDPIILNAIGRAIVDAKDSTSYAYAVEKLTLATQKDDKNPDIWVNLGNAIRKNRPGDGGGDAYTAYNKAIALNANYAVAYLRLASLFEGQKNFELVLENLNKAVSVDPKFAAGYYELFYYYFPRKKFTEAEGILQKYIDSKLPESDITDQHLYGQLCWARGDFKCAIQKAESVIAVTGQATKPKVLLLAADAYYKSGDSINAKKYIDWYYTREKPEDIGAYPGILAAKIYLKLGLEKEAIVKMDQALVIDTVTETKETVLRDFAAELKKLGKRELEADVLSRLTDIAAKPSLADHEASARGFYFGKNYVRSREMAQKLVKIWPDEIYGYDWSFLSAKVIDTVKRDSIAVPDAQKLFDYVQRDTVKYKRQLINTASYLAEYYANYATVKDKDKAIEFLKRWMYSDTANRAPIQRNIDILSRASTAPNNNTAAPRGNATPKQPAGNKPSPAVKPKTPATVKPAAVKK